MSRPSSLAFVILSTGRWLLPWLSVLFVSAVLVLGTTTAASGSRTGRHGQWREFRLASVGASAPPVDAAPQADDPYMQSRSCASLFGSYNGWLYSSGGHGPCRLELDAESSSPPDP